MRIIHILVSVGGIYAVSAADGVHEVEVDSGESDTARMMLGGILQQINK